VGVKEQAIQILIELGTFQTRGTTFCSGVQPGACGAGQHWKCEQIPAGWAMMCTAVTSWWHRCGGRFIKRNFVWFLSELKQNIPT